MSVFTSRSFERFAERLLEALSLRRVPEAGNAEHLNGKTPSQVMSQVTKISVGLGSVEDLPLATQAEAEAGVADNRLMRAASTKHTLNKFLELDSNEKGVCAGYIDGAPKFKTHKLCHRLNVVSNQAEQDLVVTAKESFADVFNNWTRISHGGNGLYPSQANELTAWEYNAGTDTIRATVNSNTFIGFVSADSFEDFDLETEVSSTNGDDDRIGILIAFVVANGKQYTLSILRQFDGYINRGASFIALYNAFQPGNFNLGWNDAGLGDPNPYHNSLGTLKSGWVGVGKVRIKVRRRGDIIECWTTLPNETTYLEDKKITIDLNSRNELSIFKGPQRFGYCCQSQLYASWKSLQRPGERWPIVRTDTLETFIWENESWTKQPAGTHLNYVYPRRFYTNQITKKLFFALTPEVVVPIQRRP